MKLSAMLARLRGGARRQPESAGPAPAMSPADRTPSAKPGILSRWLSGGGARNRVLLLLEDGAGLEARVARKEKSGQVVLGAPVQVAAGPGNGEGPPLPEVLDGVLAALSEAGEPVPRRVAWVSAAGLAALLPLPVDPAKPKPPGIMLDMTRYELEPAIATHNSLWTLGEVLAAQGVLDGEGRATVARTMASTHGGRGDGNLRFGETAIALGLATRAQIDTALAGQHRLQILDSEIACGWRGYMARDPDGHAAPHWLAAGLAGSHRQALLDTLTARGLEVAGFWPLAGLAGAWAHMVGHHCLALEIRPEQVLRLRMAEGKLAGLASEPRLEQPVTAQWLADQLTDWLSEPIDRVHLLLADGGVDGATLAGELAALLRTEVVIEAAGVDAVRDQAMGGVAGEALGQPLHWVAVPRKDPQAPLWKRADMRGPLAGIAIVLGLLSWEGYAWWRIHELKAEQIALEGRLKASSSGVAQDQSLVREAQELDLKANALRDELAHALARADMLDLLQGRISDMPALIRALGQAIDPEVVLESVRESTENDPRIGMEVRAWSPDDGKAQAYAAQVQSLVAENGLTVAQADMRSRPGRLGTPGFEVSFWLVPTTEQEEGPVGEVLPAEPTAGGGGTVPFAAASRGQPARPAPLAGGKAAGSAAP